jgi:hypothetical protein
MFKSLLSKLDTGCGIKRWLEVRGQGLGSGQLSAISYQFAGTARGRLFAAYLHRAFCSAIPIAALRTRSAAIEGEPEILAVTKITVKQALNASGPVARKVQLQR